MDNLYIEPQGFLGTGASLLADVTLLAYLLLIIPGMIAGLVFARRSLHRPHHQIIMIAITIVNWVLIIFLMLAAYRFDIAGNFSTQTTNTRYLMPIIHGLLGIPAQLLATYVVIRMAMEDYNVARAKARGEKDLRKYWFKSAKPVMRITLALWLATAALGVVSYLIRYDVIPTIVLGGNVPAPVATEEVIPEATLEGEPETTPEAEPASTPEPVATPEVTPEVSDGDVPEETPES